MCHLVQDQLGHASPVTTAIYAHTMPQAKRRMVEAMEVDSVFGYITLGIIFIVIFFVIMIYIRRWIFLANFT